MAKPTRVRRGVGLAIYPGLPALQQRVRFDSPYQPVLDIYRENEARASPERMGMALDRLQQDLTKRYRLGIWVDRRRWIGAGDIGASVSDGLHLSNQRQSR